MEQEEEPQQNEPRHSHSQSRCVTLPPGCRFHPSEELLLRYYLTNKNGTGNWNGNGGLGFDGSDLIRELDFYDYDPFELPDFACFAYGYGGRRRHWYCFTTVRVSRGERWKRKRKVKSGFWLRRGRVSNVNGVGENVVLGTRTRFVFYMGDSAKNGARTDWVLYEYALVDHVMASFVLCRVFSKPRYKNSASDIGLSCCAEESVSAVRHIGIQHDEHVKLDAVEAKVCDDISIDHNNEICAGGNSDNQVKNAHDIDALRCLAGPQGSQQLSIANFYISNNLKSLVRNGAISVGSQLAFLSSLQLPSPFLDLLDLRTHSYDLGCIPLFFPANIIINIRLKVLFFLLNGKTYYCSVETAISKSSSNMSFHPADFCFSMLFCQ